MKAMDKIDQLFVRACKSEGDSIGKLERIYKRFYLNRHNVEGFLAGVLTRIADSYLNLKASDLIYAYDPEEAWRYGIEDADSHSMKTIKILVSKIALTKTDSFPGITAPAKLRRRYASMTS